jgi:hypothetical protein
MNLIHNLERMDDSRLRKIKTEEEKVDHIEAGRTNFDLNLEVRTI